MRTLVIGICIALAACGGTGAVALEDYVFATQDAFCRHFVKCGVVESVDTCREVGTGIVTSLSASQRAAVDMGKVRYNGDQTASCLDAFADRSCDVTSQESRAVPDACFQEFTGTVHDGGACAFDAECVSQSCSATPSCSMACCMGTCVGDAPPGDARLGESCEHARCGAGAFCDDVTRVCLAQKPAGAFCGGPAECQYGLDCDPGGACVALPGPGEPCTIACRDEGTTCSATTGTCVQVGLAGSACQTSEDCSRVYRCDPTKHCSAGLPLGSACTANQHCAGDRAFCDVPEGQAMGTCILPKTDGQPCQRDAHCDSLRCDPFTLQCAPQPVCI